jgi:nitroreductase
MTVADAIHRRRSVRSYTTEAIDEATVRALLTAAVQAPTAMHAEPWMFVVVQDRPALKRYSDMAKATLLKEAERYGNLHDPSVTPKNDGFLAVLGRAGFNVFYNAGTLILICSRSTNPFVAADCWLAAENLMLAAAAMGLGTCCIGSALHAVNAPDVKAELGIAPDVNVVAAIVAGVPAELPVPQGRKEPVILTWKKTASDHAPLDQEC